MGIQERAGGGLAEMKDWFGLMFSRNALVGMIVILLGATIWFCRHDIATLQKISDNLQGIIVGYFMGKFAGDQPGGEPK